MVDALHVFTAEMEEFVVAASPEDAAAVWQEQAGEALDFGEGPVEWEQLPDEKMFRLRNEDTGELIEKTCAQYAAGGRGYLASSNP